MDCAVVVYLRTAHGVLARAVGRRAVDSCWRLQICAVVGERACRQLCVAIQRVCRSHGFPGLFCRTVADNALRSTLLARTAIFLRLVTHRGLSWTAERCGAGTGSWSRPSRDTDLRLPALCDPGALAGSD